MKSVRRIRWGKAVQPEGPAPARRNYREVKKKKHTHKKWSMLEAIHWGYSTKCEGDRASGRS